MILSIVIPTHNRSTLLKQNLLHLKNSKKECGDFEMLVVDDYSDIINQEKNAQLCKKFNSRYLFSSTKAGPARVRNMGIKESKGSWIAFLDDDVFIEENWFITVMELISNADKNTLGFEGAVHACGKGLWDNEVENRTGNLYLSCNVIYKKEILNKLGGFDESFTGPYAEDQELALRILKLGTIIFSKECIVYHTARNVNIFSYLFSSVSRMRNLLNAELIFYLKHKNGYHRFRHADSFWQTYANIMTKNIFFTIKRRSFIMLVSHPVQLLILILSSLIEQITAIAIMPKFIIRYLFTQNKKTCPPIITHDKASPLKVWLAADIPDNSYGGVGRTMHELSQGLQLKGIKTECIDRGVLTASNYLIFALKLAYRLLITVKNRPDWIISRSSDGVFLALCVKIFRIKTRIILHNHGWEECVYNIEKKMSKSLLSSPTTFKALFFRFPILRLTLSLCDYCLTGTKNEVVYLKKHYIKNSGKIIYFPNAITSIIPNTQINNGIIKPHFLSVANNTWKKNLIHTLNIFCEIKTKIPDAVLTCVGTGIDNDAFGKLIAEDEMSIVNIPSVPFNEMGRFYKAHPILISSSRYEGGHSLAILEALSFGNIVFASAILSNREIITDSINGYLISGSSAQRDATYICKMLNTSEIKNVRVQAVKQSRLFTRHNQISELETILCKR